MQKVSKSANSQFKILILFMPQSKFKRDLTVILKTTVGNFTHFFAKL